MNKLLYSKALLLEALENYERYRVCIGNLRVHGREELDLDVVNDNSMKLFSYLVKIERAINKKNNIDKNIDEVKKDIKKLIKV